MLAMSLAVDFHHDKKIWLFYLYLSEVHPVKKIKCFQWTISILNLSLSALISVHLRLILSDTQPEIIYWPQIYADGTQMKSSKSLIPDPFYRGKNL